MASAWGLSWGEAWGNSWGIVEGFVPPPEPAPAPEARRGGGAFWLRQPYRRIRRKAVEVIEEVAKRQVQDTGLDDLQKLQELMAELEARAVAFDERYVRALQARREMLIDEEIGIRMREVMKKRRQEEETLIFMILNELQ